ncbi:MAG: asparagine synthetase B [Beijerinckiaceae bacterium]|nr:asparagine synthetase B [Beijerinckiaceae bacterium]
MCGIAVAIEWDGAATIVRQLVDGLSHRGDISDPIVTPWPNVAMGTRRLRIVDGAHGIQPQISWDGRILVSFNGEIYNHAALRRDLEAEGAKFRTNSDTEVLATALSHWGPKALGRLNGMFAFVAVDIGTGQFLAARDPFGVKPLYLIQSEIGFLFCSEIRPLLSATEKGNVLMLPPGHLITRTKCARFKSFEVDPTQATAANDPAKLDRLLAAAVHCRIPPDLPVALMFSGGIDSTLVAHYARQIRPDAPAYFLGGPNAPDYRHAVRYAGMTDLDLRFVSLESASLDTPDLIREIAITTESFEPEVIRGSLCTYLLSQQVHQDGYRVALCGEGADELFAGYVPLELAFADSNVAGIFVRNQHLGTINKTCLQRNDRCGMRFQLELREPFFDPSVVDYALGLDSTAVVENVNGRARGKAPLRALYDLYSESLPISIRDRRKVPMNEGCGFDTSQNEGPWNDFAEQTVRDRDFEDGKRRFAQFDLLSKEEFLYLDALATSMDVFRVPHLTARARLVFPAVKNSEILRPFMIPETI